MQNVFGLCLIGCHSKVVFWCPFQSWSWITLAFSPFGQNLHSWYGNSRFWGLKKTEYFAKHIIIFMVLNVSTLPLSHYNHYHFPSLLSHHQERLLNHFEGWISKRPSRNLKYDSHPNCDFQKAMKSLKLFAFHQKTRKREKIIFNIDRHHHQNLQHSSLLG